MVTIARKHKKAQELINLEDEGVYLNVKKHFFYYERGLKDYPIWKSKSSYAEVGRSRM